MKGIEPSPPAWKAGALPLSYTRETELSTILISSNQNRSTSNRISTSKTANSRTIRSTTTAKKHFVVLTQRQIAFRRARETSVLDRSGLARKYTSRPQIALNSVTNPTNSPMQDHLGFFRSKPVQQWGEQDSNLRRNNPTDLQSVPFGRFGIPPDLTPTPFTNKNSVCRGQKKPAEGLEPTTSGLQNRCSTN